MKIPRNILYTTPGTIAEALLSLLRLSAPGGAGVEEFQERFKRFIGVRHGIATASGTAALYLCLEALGAKKGDKVILSDFNVPEVPALLLAMGLEPVLIDIDPRSFNMDPELIGRCIDEHTRFILVTHMFGAPADLQRISAIARKNNLTVIEDACQAVGAEIDGKKAGTSAAMGYYSFGALKTFSTFGGGFVVSDNAEHIEFARALMRGAPFTGKGKLFREIARTALIKAFTSARVFSCLTYPLLRVMNALDPHMKFSLFKGREIASMPAGAPAHMVENFTNIQASAGIKNLANIQRQLEDIRKAAKQLDSLLSELRVPFQECLPSAKSSYFKYVIRVQERSAFLESLFKRGVDATCGYMRSCSLIREFQGYSRGCPESRKLEEEHVYVPVHSLRSERDIRFLADALKASLKV